MITVLESLSNELFMQIFEHLDAYHLFKAFFNTNSHFNRLLTDHRLGLKFYSKNFRENDKININTWQTMVNYLTAVTLINDRHIRMFMSISKESHFLYLQSLTLHQVRIRKEKSSIVKFLSKLKSLKNLRIQSIGEMHDLTLMILCSNDLFNLISYESKNSEYPTTVIFTWQITTNIQYLTIDCILYNLSGVLSQTPKLKYLNIDLTSYGRPDTIDIEFPLPKMLYLTHLIIKIHFVSYIQFIELIKIMPCLKTLDLSGNSMGENFDNGQKLKNLFGHLQEIIIDELKCLTSISSKDIILETFNNDIDKFWSDVSCSIEYDRAFISAFGYKK